MVFVLFSDFPKCVMKKRIIITVIGVITLPMADHGLREKSFIEALSAELNQYFPEFEPDVKEPMVAVAVQDMPDPHLRPPTQVR